MVIALGVAHPLHLAVAYFRYQEATDDITALTVAVAFNGVLSAVLILSGYALAMFRKHAVALVACWVYSLLLMLGMMIGTGLGAYSRRPLMLVLQLTLALGALTVAILLSIYAAQASSNRAS